MSFLDKSNISTRLIVASLAAGFGLLIMTGIAIFSLDRVMLEDRQTKTRHLVEVAHGVLAHYHRLQTGGEMGEADARKAALAALRGLRYDDKEYFWVHDLQLKMVMHPMKPELDGKDISTLKDPSGFALFQRMNQVVKQSGAGFVEYIWDKPGSEQPQPKVSYVQAFEPWGWIVGSGIYLDDVKAAFWRYALQFLAVLGVGMVILQTLFWLITRSIVGQLGGEPLYAMEVAGRIAQGDLSQSIVSTRPGSVLESMRDMQANLNTLFRRVQEMAEQLSTGARALSASVGEISIASSQQAESSSTVAAAIEEMAVSINEVAEIAKQTEANSDATAHQAEQSEALIRDASASIAGIATTVERAGEQIQTLRARSEQIGSIATVINDIANQTNLLALNAAIEAARAGEMGRGFSVVADEVRTLAERTTKATAEIAEMVAHVQGETGEVVISMQDAAPQVQEGLAFTRQIADTLERIHGQARDSLDKAHDAAHATKEQASAMDDIARHMEQIANGAEKTHASVRTNAEQARLLESWAGELRGSVARFRLA